MPNDYSKIRKKSVRIALMSLEAYCSTTQANYDEQLKAINDYVLFLQKENMGLKTTCTNQARKLESYWRSIDWK